VSLRRDEFFASAKTVWDSLSSSFSILAIIFLNFWVWVTIAATRSGVSLFATCS
jgi:hypothetical protein